MFRIANTIVLLSVILFYISLLNVSGQNTGLCDPKDTLKHVIVTSEVFKNQTGEYTLDLLRKHRIDKGLSSTIVTVEDIYQAYEGRDNAEKVRNFIRDARNTWKTEYVLLGGDINHVPHRMMFARNRYVAADMYFGCLDGDFNANNNAKWGEPGDGLDFTFDVHVGRASAENISEMSNFVYKTITYENSPVNASYHTKTMLFNQNASGVGKIDFWAGEIRGLTNQLSVEYYYLTNQQATLVTNNRMSSKNLGYFLGASHGFVDGHGNINHNQARSYSNADQFYFFMSIACLVGKFEQDCVIETITTSTKTGGAFAAFANSHESYAPFVTQFIRVKMRDLVFKDKVYELGRLRSMVQTRYSESEYNSKEGERYQAYIFNLFGDPATQWKIDMSEPIDLAYSFNNQQGNTCNDISGNKHHGNLENVTLTSNGVVSSAVSFNGVDSRIVVPHSDWNPMGDQMEITISAWIKADRVDQNAGIVVKGDSKMPFALSMNNNGKLQFEINKNSPTRGLQNKSFVSNSVLTPNTWQHVALVINYVSSSLTFYINGVAETSQSMPAGWLMGYTNEPLYIGSTGNAANSFFAGDIDELYIYSRSLAASEIVSLMGKTTSAQLIPSETNSLKALIFPNPVKNSQGVTVRFENYLVKGDTNLVVYNTAGQKVIKKPINAGYGANQYYIEETEKLDPGIYIVGLKDAYLSKNIGRFVVIK